MSLKPVRFLYQAKSNQTGLTDVKAQIYLNGAPVAVLSSAIAATELDVTNSPGIYEILLTESNLATWGVVAGQENTIEARIDSVSKPAQAIAKASVFVSSTDDIEAHLVTQDTAIAAVKSDTAAIKADLETGPNSLANIYTALVAIQNNAGFAVPVPSQMLIPQSGTNQYQIPLTIYNEVNNLIDPDSQTITVGLVNQAGISRNSYLGSTTAVRDSLGQYHVNVNIAAAVAQEELIFTFSYSIGTKATARKGSTVTITDVVADGFALQSTLLAVQTTVNSNNSLLTDSGYGLQVTKGVIDLIKTQTDKIGDATIGLSAIKTAVNGVQDDLTNNVKGSGFNASTDSLHSIGQYLIANIFSGGRAV